MAQSWNAGPPENPAAAASRRSASALAICRAAIASALCFCVAALALPASAQTANANLSDPLRRPGWNFGGDLFGGFTVRQITSPNFLTANRNIADLALTARADRVLTHDHGPGFLRGTFQWGANVIPVEIFFVLGSHYAGGVEPVVLRWNFTANRNRVVPFAGAAGGLLFSPQNFPPGNTYQTNFTAAIDAGAHIFVRRHQSFDITGRVFHLSNAYLGPSNPGIPISLQFAVGYTWY